ncbi:MAG: hypothetical protein ACTILN_06955 [Marinobacter sp.]
MPKDVKQAGISILIVCSALIFSGCGSSSGSGSKAAVQASELQPGAFFIGRQFSDRPTVEGVSLISSTGKFVVIFSSHSLTFGNLQFSDSGNISGQLDQYIYRSPWERTDGSLSGEVKSSERADLTASGPGVTSNSVLFRDQSSSGPGVTMGALSGTYTVTDPDNTSWITVDPIGQVTGGDQGCVFNGEVAIPDSSINLFEINYEAENCSALPNEDALASDRNGEFSGLGRYDRSRSEIYFYSRNGTVAKMFIGTK